MRICHSHASACRVGPCPALPKICAPTRARPPGLFDFARASGSWNLPKNPKRSIHPWEKVNGRRIIGASRKSLFRNSFWSPRTCSDYPPDETWGDRVECEFIPAGSQGSPRRRGNGLAALPVKHETSPKEGFLRIPRLLMVATEMRGIIIMKIKRRNSNSGYSRDLS